MRFDAVWPRVMSEGNEWGVPRLTVSLPYSYRNLDRAMPVRAPHYSPRCPRPSTLISTALNVV
jgi:hypothetical protein